MYHLCYLYAKNYQSWWKFERVLAETILHSFFGTRCIWRAPRFVGGQQQDSHEVLRHLLKEVKDEHCVLTEQRVNEASLEPLYTIMKTYNTLDRRYRRNRKMLHKCFNCCWVLAVRSLTIVRHLYFTRYVFATCAILLKSYYYQVESQAYFSIVWSVCLSSSLSVTLMHAS